MKLDPHRVVQEQHRMNRLAVNTGSKGTREAARVVSSVLTQILEDFAKPSPKAQPATWRAST